MALYEVHFILTGPQSIPDFNSLFGCAVLPATSMINYDMKEGEAENLPVVFSREYTSFIWFLVNEIQYFIDVFRITILMEN
jgi:hypothetical protein